MFRPHDIQVTGKSVPTDVARALIAADVAKVNGPIEKGEILLRSLKSLASHFSASRDGEKRRSAHLLASILPCIDATPRAPELQHPEP
jgi:hypothetical protein